MLAGGNPPDKDDDIGWAGWYHGARDRKESVFCYWLEKAGLCARDIKTALNEYRIGDHDSRGYKNASSRIS